MPLFMSENTTFESVLFSVASRSPSTSRRLPPLQEMELSPTPTRIQDILTARCMVIGLLKVLHLVSGLDDRRCKRK
jgi:hypothetical protein